MTDKTQRRPRPRLRRVPNQMNKTEQAYAAHLDMLVRAGQIRSWMFEGVKLRLAEKTFYCPDFLVVTDTEIQCHEVKGFWEDDARVKIKVAAQMFPFLFVAVRKTKAGWEREEF